MLILDTAGLPAHERAEAIQDTVSASASTSLASFEDPATTWARLQLVELGAGRVFNTDAGGLSLRRSPRLARSTAADSSWSTSRHRTSSAGRAPARPTPSKSTWSSSRCRWTRSILLPNT